jgi:uncharacterized membrane protein
MLLATLLISGWDWLWPALLFLVAAVVLLGWAYKRAPVNPGIRTACLALKTLGFLALLACLLEPLWSGQRARPGSNYFAILADNSQGMQIKDAEQNRSRGEVLRETLTSEKLTWQGKIEENFQVRRYLFDSRLQFSRNFGELNFDGRATALGGSLRALADRYKGQPLAGVLLLTDGNATDLADGLDQLPSSLPVYPVVIGTDTAIKDLAIQKVTVAQTAFEDAPVTIQADVSNAGYSGEEIVAQLAELVDYPTSSPGSGPAVEPGASNSVSNPGHAEPSATLRHDHVVIREKSAIEQIQKARRDGENLTFRFQVRPEKSGIRFYRLRLSAKKELDQFTEGRASTEATLANNTRIVVVDRGRGPYRVLYVTGRPNWEYKFLHRALEEDDQIQLSAIIRIAKREPKMDFRGRAGESSNPLYRGFTNQSKEETERYDQPVLRAIASDQEEWNRIVHGFPKTADDLYRYHAVILDDLEAEFFTRDQMMLLQKFVSERGGGVMMLGGQESLHEGQYDRTPIGEMLPVYLDQPAEARPGAGYRFDLTREGWLQPWVRLRNNESDERKRISEMPPFFVVNQVRDFKPGASVVATVADASGKARPALIVQRYGNGRTAAMTIGDFWHWGFKDKDSRKDMNKAWRQMVRWLVSDVPGRIEAQVVQKASDPDQAVQLQVRVRDEKFQPLDNAAVALAVRPVGHQVTSATAPAVEQSSGKSTGVIRLNAEASLSEPGLYQATYIPRLTGGYFVDVIVTNAVGAEVGRTEAAWSSDPAAEEFRSLQPNRRLLQEIATKTGGELIAPAQLESFAQGLPQRKVPIAESWSIPLWHQPLVFMLALACFVGEWGLRRWKGLA